MSADDQSDERDSVTDSITVGLLHPGQMGASVGGCARAAGADVVWASAGRSAATRSRAEDESLRDVGTLDALLAESEVVFSICPPGAALALGEEVAALAFHGTFVDANALDPATSRQIGSVVEAAGARFVDGGIIGPPASAPGLTRLYLSGDRAAAVAAIFADGPLEAIALAGPVGAASSLKMAFAAWTKGSSALLLAVRALARAEGVDEALTDQWRKTHPHLAALSEGTARGTAPKAWRFADEMREIAATFASAGLPDGFHRAAAEIYERLGPFKDDSERSTLEAVVARLLGDDPGGS